MCVRARVGGAQLDEMNRWTVVGGLVVLAAAVLLHSLSPPRTSQLQAPPLNKSVAIIGGGITGVHAASILNKLGFDTVIFEQKAPPPQWLDAYPESKLQNISPHYHIPDFSWSQAGLEPALRAKGTTIVRYTQLAAEHFGLKVRTNTTVKAVSLAGDQHEGWTVASEKTGGGSESTVVEKYDHVLVATGTLGKVKSSFINEKELPGLGRFKGKVLGMFDVKNLDETFVKGQNVVIVGFGITSVDLAELATNRGSQVHHVFRQPRWTVPETLFGMSCSYILFARHSTLMMPGWNFPTTVERLLHTYLAFVPALFWKAIEQVVLFHVWYNRPEGSGSDARGRVELALPQTKDGDNPLLYELRCAIFIMSKAYYPRVATGQILPYKTTVRSLTETGVILETGQEIPADVVILALGPGKQSFPYLSEEFRGHMEKDTEDDVQLYRHVLHPRLPHSLGFMCQTGLLHYGLVHVSTLWLGAIWRGELVLPPRGEMDRATQHIEQYKRDNILWEPVKYGGVCTRFQHYIDSLLLELGISPWRRMPNVFSELLMPPSLSDYAGVVDEYLAARNQMVGKETPLYSMGYQT